MTTTHHDGNFYVCRIDTREPFQMRSVIMPDANRGLMSCTLSHVLNNEVYNKQYNLSKECRWISNGTFFYPNGNVRPHKDKPEKPVYSGLLAPVKSGDVVSDTIPYLQGKPKDRRTMFTLKYNADGSAMYYFIKKSAERRIKDFEKYDQVIGGGGELITYGREITDLKYWNTEEGGSFSGTDQSYSTGTIIADNGDGIVYLIMNTNIPGNYSCNSESSFSWKHASLWLKNDFMKQFDFKDGSIYTAIALDGSSARQLVFDGKKIPIYQKEADGQIVESVRAVPHFICVK